MLISLLILSCTSRKNYPVTENNIELNPKLIFLNYTITENNKGEKSIDFISKTITEGKARNNNNKYIKTGEIGDLKCSQFDNKNQPLQSVFIKNPLNKTIEFLNDSLQFESKALTLKKTPFSLRLQLHSKTKHIVIAEIMDSSQNTKSLLITKLETK